MKHTSPSENIPLRGSLAALCTGAALTCSGTAAEMNFPVNSDEGVISVEWQGDSQARAGQSYEYQLNVRNDSEHPVHQVVVHQQVPSTFQIQESQPPTEQETRIQGRSGESFQQGMNRMSQEGRQRSQQAAQAVRQAIEADRDNQGQTRNQRDRDPSANQQGRTNQDRDQRDRNQNQSDRQPRQMDQDRDQRDGNQNQADRQPRQANQDRDQRDGNQNQADRQPRQANQDRDQRDRNQNQADRQRDRNQSQADQRQQRDSRTAADRQRRGDENRTARSQETQREMQDLSWRIGSLKPGDSKVITVTGRPQGEGNIESCIWVSFQPTMCQTIKVVKPDLELEQTVLDINGNERNIFYACENVVVKYELTNPGSGTTEPATIEINVPESVSFTGDGSETISVGELEPGESVTREVRFEASESGRLQVSATATTGDLEASSARASIEIVRPSLELTIDGPDRAYLGRSVTYNVTVENTSDVPALDTVVEFPLTEGALRFASTGERIEGDVERFTLGDLEGGESKSFGVTFDPSDVGEIETTAVATAFCAKDQEQQVATTVEGIPALQIFVVDRDDPVQVGDETVYELQVRNEGTMEDVNIRLTGELPDTLEFISSEGDSDISASGGTLEFDAIDTLAPGDVVSWNIRVQGTQEGRGAFRVNLESDSVKDVRSSEPTTVY